MKNKEILRFLMIVVESILVQGVEKEKNRFHQERVLIVMIGHLEKIIPEMDIVQGKSLYIHQE